MIPTAATREIGTQNRNTRYPLLIDPMAEQARCR
jgi:hypothetical protein